MRPSFKRDMIEGFHDLLELAGPVSGSADELGLEIVDEDHRSLCGIDALKYLLTSLEDCDDVLPAPCCSKLNLPQGTTYAEAIRQIRSEPKMYLGN